VRPDIPRELARLVQRCLAIDPVDRYQSALDLRHGLEEIEQDLDSGELASIAARSLLYSVAAGPAEHQNIWRLSLPDGKVSQVTDLKSRFASPATADDSNIRGPSPGEHNACWTRSPVSASPFDSEAAC
jgi:serine/threonine protein kinase